jgi:hypothetical protein
MTTCESEVDDSWMRIFDEVEFEKMSLASTQMLPKCVEYKAATNNSLLMMDVEPTDTTPFNDVMKPNPGSIESLCTYNTGLFQSQNKHFTSISTTSVPSKNAHVGFTGPVVNENINPVTRGIVKRKPRKVPLDANELHAKVMKNRENAAKNRVKQANNVKDLRDTVKNLRTELKDKTNMLNQVSLSLHNEMRTTMQLKETVQRLSVP